ncbi:hypothetical protein KM043_009041 [Ampulex compressa]|nr:hypothetical protein KM043_009041 [Ampulex compressa]
MELVFSILSILSADLRVVNVDMIYGFVKVLITVLLLILGSIVYLTSRRYALKKRKQVAPIQNKILLQSATTLAKKIRRREVTSEEVISAYIVRCEEVNPLLNAIVESNFEAAISNAREVDEFLRTCALSEEELARDLPLLGLPITVKQSIAVKGLSHAVGLKRLAGVKASEDAEVIKRVRKAGGIPLLISNTPELCFFWESYNVLTGMTMNPYDSRKTAGGSSGGEGALLGAGASLLSLGSDVAGSVRLPAMFCGVFGHKPSADSVPNDGHKPNADDPRWSSFFSVAPMARYAEDLPLLFSVVAQNSKASQSLAEKTSLKNMRFFYVDDNYGSIVLRSPSREIKSAIHDLVRYIENTYGIKVHKANLNEAKYMFEASTVDLLSVNDADCIFTSGNNRKEWRSVTMELLRYIFCMSSHPFYSIFYGILKRINDALPKSVHNRMRKKKEAILKEFQNLLGDNGVLICPCFISSAHYPKEMYYKVCNTIYMMVYNMLGFPVTQCPIRLDSNDRPIGVQIVGNLGCDRLTFAVAEEIQRGFGGWRPPPCDAEKTV